MFVFLNYENIILDSNIHEFSLFIIKNELPKVEYRQRVHSSSLI